ncbi:MAG: hypothetical protein OJF49_003224 [Ktedonobacterales bacterium]|jgi:hypothetical protein|nr:MAG: hypothetical protein OJF49_003224 [Ktedonobacterales bacterium]
MSNHVSNNTTTTTTTATGAPTHSPTLDDLLAARRSVRAEERAEAEAHRARQIAQEREDAMNNLAALVRDHFSAELMHALAAEVDYDEQREDDDNTGAIVTITVHGEPWILAYRYFQGYRPWRVYGPNSYHEAIPINYSGEDLTSALLDAIDDYPAWMEQQAAKRAESADIPF